VVVLPWSSRPCSSSSLLVVVLGECYKVALLWLPAIVPFFANVVAGHRADVFLQVWESSPCRGGAVEFCRFLCSCRYLAYDAN
jgi:hypothetical protein